MAVVLNAQEATGIPTFERIVLHSLAKSYGATGCVDYNNDGWPDMMSSAEGLLYTQIGASWGYFDPLPSPKTNPNVQLTGDYDNDGDYDIALFEEFWKSGEEIHLGEHRLLRQERGTFTDQTQASGLVDVDSLGFTGALWLDYDRDGWLDLYLGRGNYGQVPRFHSNGLFRNNGDGTFTETTEEAGLDIDFHPDDLWEGVPGASAKGTWTGYISSDFNDDGWPDLFVPVVTEPNRLFFNDGQGRFIDATTSEIDDEGDFWGADAGDIDNDGDIDLLYVAGGTQIHRSGMLLNLGQGQFLDVTEAVGLSITTLAATDTISYASFADLDNDGDLDIQASIQYFPKTPLFLNDGSGMFTFLPSTGLPTLDCMEDVDRDGALDIWSEEFIGGERRPVLHRNNTQGNHYLRVELVGTASSRTPFGARVTAVTGVRRQGRDLSAGNGYRQPEPVVHFGLGDDTLVDSLIVRWPSGRVEVFTNVAVDKHIRIIEGQDRYHLAAAAEWIRPLPETLQAGQTVTLDAILSPPLFEADARITAVIADLSALGGPPALPLQDQGDGSYRLVTSLVVQSSGFQALTVHVDQVTSLGSQWLGIPHTIWVLGEGRALYTDGVASDWVVRSRGGPYDWQESNADIDPSAVDQIYGGSAAIGFELVRGFPSWRVTLFSDSTLYSFGPALPDNMIELDTNSSLHFAFHRGETPFPDPPLLQVDLGLPFQVDSSTAWYYRTVDLIASGLVDPHEAGWQVVGIPLEQPAHLLPPGLIMALGRISFKGNQSGPSHLDDIRVIAARPEGDPNTVVAESFNAALPQSTTLAQNYPNPFNSSTVIRFALPEPQSVELAVYNLTGQRVATLTEGVREAGTYAVGWDGRDDDGRALASGVYLYRLQTGSGQEVEMRKLLLLR